MLGKASQTIPDLNKETIRFDCFHSCFFSTSGSCHHTQTAGASWRNLNVVLRHHASHFPACFLTPGQCKKRKSIPNGIALALEKQGIWIEHPECSSGCSKSEISPPENAFPSLYNSVQHASPGFSDEWYSLPGALKFLSCWCISHAAGYLPDLEVHDSFTIDL